VRGEVRVTVRVKVRVTVRVTVRGKVRVKVHTELFRKMVSFQHNNNTLHRSFNFRRADQIYAWSNQTKCFRLEVVARVRWQECGDANVVMRRVRARQCPNAGSATSAPGRIQQRVHKNKSNNESAPE
jgi:hypothetical protein